MRRAAYLIASVLIIGALGGILGSFFDFGGKKISITRDAASSDAEEHASGEAGDSGSGAVVVAQNPLTGESCGNGDKRPVAVMLAGDAAARPLSGIAEADIVVEMPVLQNGITRYMAVFRCEEPQDIGPVRSARHDFLPFAKSFDAVFAHWGGSYLALDILRTRAIDNIDALVNPFETFYRKEGLVAPDNGFASFAKLSQTAADMGYRADTAAKKYVHIRDEALLFGIQHIMLGYPFPYNVVFDYNPQTNTYLRSRGGKKELDGQTQKQVEVKNLIVMTASSRQVSKDYNEVDVTGEGNAVVYRNGQAVRGKWKRIAETYAKGLSLEDNKYYFVDADGAEIGLVPGKIWIAVIQQNQKVEQIFE
ncbi:hypothetical protein A3C91_04160 [Candidatus Azambacteria bacterium RIFCSPHIGHO2_02_FULL_52_12]|uniref:DUF3048 domain-containing protein n=1 Tax=Candidatus Azambacteria bacterium RIFCSPLOWO2_01_FULL_46_25 TaxID=1797298 RepID=A0A1F5BUZ7_9BACT|nr:MAG: hypothetical protein A3C91_04160 [Candidatus Azambacteria bacterium RIFCSPHIGHO2_02_FULL_52_12]OGD34437.1 MAG: hypothetical protein A2988_02845 [Candidatus Azambacteria bacterium RIFCSPLOWO2_01_FULL_46_25]OGD37285.1 MAG: hypothetical protein A2850_01045 [Candidatus Azambacteria bacterium RIFCSPHIGHO2_01_FULL_51_74]